MKKESIIFTIVVCLHDSFEFLEEQLTRIVAQKDIDIGVEVIIIDNASSPEVGVSMRKLVGQFEPLVRYIIEPRLGAQFARNRGIVESRGECLLYLDDDALPSKGWLTAMAKCYTENPNRLIQGRITLLYKEARPHWITPHLEMFLSKIDFGHEERPIPPHLVLANMGIPRIAFELAGGWEEDIGRKGDLLLSGEDFELASRVAEKTHMQCWYCGGANVEHVVKSNRYEKGFHLERSYWQGVTMGYMRKKFPHTRRYSRGVLSQLKIGLASLVLWFIHSMLRDNESFTYKCRFRQVIGYVYGCCVFNGLNAEGVST